MRINNLKVSKKFLLICIVSVMAILVCGVAYAVVGDSIAKALGKQQANVLANAGDGIVATIDGEKITKKGFDTYKLLVNGGEIKLTDKEILDKILDRQVIYKQALKEGITATDVQVVDAIKTARDAMQNSSIKQYAAFKDYISGLNMTEDQYWESVRPVYKKSLICGNYKNTLKEKYKKDNNISDLAELNVKFNDFYDKHIKELKSKSKIDSNIK